MGCHDTKLSIQTGDHLQQFLSCHDGFVPTAVQTCLQLQHEHSEAVYILGVLASEEGRLERSGYCCAEPVAANAPDAHAHA